MKLRTQYKRYQTAKRLEKANQKRKEARLMGIVTKEEAQNTSNVGENKDYMTEGWTRG